eukprot:1334698-Prymnesium_polylepis.1
MERVLAARRAVDDAQAEPGVVDDTQTEPGVRRTVVGTNGVADSEGAARAAPCTVQRIGASELLRLPAAALAERLQRPHV